MKTALRFFIIVGLLSALIVTFLYYGHFAARTQQAFKFSAFLDELDDGRIREVNIRGNELRVSTREGGEYKTYAPQGYNAYNLVSDLRKKGVTVSSEDSGSSPWVSWVVQGIVVILVMGVMWILFMRQMQIGGNKALSFGKSRAKLLTTQQKRVTFRDVAGVDEAREELQEIIDFLKDPQKFIKLGGRIPKGVLLMGPPGTGKTLLARAIAGEANVPFFSISGSDFVEMFVGVGASRVRDLFEQGKKNAPCIIFIDEIDAVGRHRGAGLGGGHDEREQTLNQLLVEMDGFEPNEGVILIAATNRPDVLDPALLRPGRFDRRIVVNRPDLRGREGILGVHTRKVPLSTEVDIKKIARGTPGFSGADLANLVNEAALMAARLNRKAVAHADFEYAKDKVLMGAERRSLILTDGEKRNTAYHEAGHALVAHLLPGTDPVHKVTIIPRGRALGLTQQLPLDDRYNYNKDFLENMIAICLGGRISAELTLGQITSGAENDLETATELARKMVCDWGMSAELGPISFGKKEEAVFLGRDFSQQTTISPETADKIDQEMKKIILNNYSRAKTLLEENRHLLEKIAEALLEHETLDTEQIQQICDGLPITKPQTDEEPARKEAATVKGRPVPVPQS